VQDGFLFERSRKMNTNLKSVYEQLLAARYTEDGKAYFMSGFYLTKREDALKMIEALKQFYEEVSEEEIEAENRRLNEEITVASRFQR
jgi:hypothetical protein